VNGDRLSLSKTCRAIRPPSQKECGALPTHVVTFRDGDRAAVCADCALYLGQVAGAHGTTIQTERIS
jgi:hypothetical protein